MCALSQAEEWITCAEVINKDLYSMPSQLQDQAQYMKGQWRSSRGACVPLPPQGKGGGERKRKDGRNINKYLGPLPAPP